MSVFGDADPEDAYDANDPPLEKIALLWRVLMSIEDEAQNPTHDHARAVVRLAFGVRVVHELQQLHDPRTRVILTALLVGFLLLQVDEGP